MEKHKNKILAFVIIAIIAILGNKFLYNSSSAQTPVLLVDAAIKEHTPVWILFRSQT